MYKIIHINGVMINFNPRRIRLSRLLNVVRPASRLPSYRAHRTSSAFLGNW